MRRLLAYPDCPPSVSQAWWRRLLDTPLGDLCAGRVTGRANPARVITEALLPEPIRASVWRCTIAAGGRRARRAALAERLLSQSALWLSRGQTPEEISAELLERQVFLKLWGRAAPEQCTKTTLPAAVGCTLAELMQRTRARRGRAELYFTLHRHCVERLAAGTLPAELASRFGEPAAAELLGRPRVAPVALVANLPVAILRLIAEVVRRTRLWRRERDDVARELCAHFADGLQAGRAADELVLAFGPATTAARLIRRGRIRSRPVSWQLARRGGQGALAISLAAALYFGTLIGWLRLAGAPQRFYPIDQVDSQRASIPQEDRAWPHYRAALEQLAWPSDATQSNSVRNALSLGPKGSLDWDAALSSLAANEGPLRQIVAGSERPTFGFVYRDPANDAWLAARHHSDVARTWPSVVPGFRVLLPQIQDMDLISVLLSGATHRAEEDGDSAAVGRYLIARLRFARQIWESAEFSIIESVAGGQFEQAATATARLVSVHSEHFSDESLTELTCALEEIAPGPIRHNVPIFREQVLQLIAGLYSDDGSGNGRFTAEGIAELREWLIPGNFVPELAEWRTWLTTRDGGSWVDGLRAEIAGATLASRIADRRDALALAERLLALYEEDRARDPWDPAESEAQQELDRIRDDPTLRTRYIGVLLPFQIANLTPLRPRAGQLQLARDTARLAVALEQFRRRRGAWPAGLNELVPERVAAVPLDPHDGRPLRYLLSDGRPHVYSVGLDRVDNTAADAGVEPGDAAAAVLAAVSVRDLKLLPVEEPQFTPQ